MTKTSKYLIKWQIAFLKQRLDEVITSSGNQYWFSGLKNESHALTPCFFNNYFTYSRQSPLAISFLAVID